MREEYDKSLKAFQDEAKQRELEREEAMKKREAEREEEFKRQHQEQQDRTLKAKELELQRQKEVLFLGFG